MATCFGFTITMNGSGFVPQSKVQWDGRTCPFSGGSGTLCTTTITTDTTTGAVVSITATIDAALVSKPGLASVNTLNPSSGSGVNGLSNIVNFIINNPPNPVPTVSSVSPTCALAGNSLALTVTSSNFLTGSSNPSQVSTLNWTIGQTLFQFSPSSSPPATVTSTQVSVTIPAADIPAGSSSASVTVFNPPSLAVPNLPGSTGSGGGNSGATSVTVQSTPCPVAAKTAAAAAEAAAVSEETPAVSVDGRYVAYAAVQDGHSQIFLRDTCEGAPTGCQPRTSLLSLSSDGTGAAGDSHTPSMSSDGRYVAFSSAASNLVENAPPGRQIYLRDTCAGAGDSCKPGTSLVSTDSGGALLGTESILPSVSSSGRFVAFLAITPSHSASGSSSEAKGPANSTNSGFRQVLIRDTCLGATNCTAKTTRISLQPGDASEASPAGPALGGNAKNVALAAGNLATLFTRSVPVDDRVFLAITSDQR